MIRVRFAPSPTGHLHIGGARTALFNYLYVKNRGGHLILRIEDTDLERSTPEMAREIVAGMKWLGLNWDEGPYFQSERRKRHLDIADQIRRQGDAYYCFCSAEELAEHRLAAGVKPKDSRLYMYDRRCLGLTKPEVNQLLAEDRPHVTRFRVPDGIGSFKDMVHGEMTVNHVEIEDFVLVKSDGYVTYQLSVVTDDLDMGISHVLRGDDHISNTFKQLLIYRALKAKPPRFAHLPLILGADRKKLSKRHGETSILEFKKRGILPEALFNYLAQLSWNPGDDRRVYPAQELIGKFDLKKVTKNSPVFDYTKLNFLNARAIADRDTSSLYDLLQELYDVDSLFPEIPHDRKFACLDLLKSRLKSLAEAPQLLRRYLLGDLTYSIEDLTSLGLHAHSIPLLEDWKNRLQQLDHFVDDQLEEALRLLAEERGLKAGELIHPTRYAVTASRGGPSLFEVLTFLGKEETLKRIDRFLNHIKADVFSD